jgi:SpoVK/Ycf46/Vps4 family AAA+-type ATPase
VTRQPDTHASSRVSDPMRWWSFAGVPGEEARWEILKVLLRGTGDVAMAPEVSDVAIREVARKAHGFVGADLLLLVKEAVMDAARRGRQGEEQGA